MTIVREMKYRMGFQVNGEPIPDPAVFTGKNSALDSQGGRDATGTLHRAMVARKHPIKLEYHAITFEVMRGIMELMQGESFQFTFPDPMEGSITVKAYCGDLDWSTHMATEYVQAGDSDNLGWQSGWLGDLSFSVIEF